MQIVKQVIFLISGAIIVLLMGLGFYKIKRYRDVQQFLQFEIEQQEERANRPMSFVNLILDNNKYEHLVDDKEQVTPVLAQEVLSSKKRAFVTVILKLPRQSESESEKLTVGSAFVTVNQDLFKEEKGFTENIETKKQAKQKIIDQLFRPILDRNRSHQNEIASRSSFVNNALDLENDNNILENEPTNHSL